MPSNYWSLWTVTATVSETVVATVSATVAATVAAILLKQLQRPFQKLSLQLLLKLFGHVTNQITSIEKSNPNQIKRFQIKFLYSNQINTRDSVMISIKSWFGLAHKVGACREHTFNYNNSSTTYNTKLTDWSFVTHIWLAKHHNAVPMCVESLAHHSIGTHCIANDRPIFRELMADWTWQHFWRRPRPHWTKLRPQLPVTSFLLAQLTLGLHHKVAQMWQTNTVTARLIATQDEQGFVLADIRVSDQVSDMFWAGCR